MKRSAILTLILSSIFCLISLLLLLRGPIQNLERLSADESAFAAAAAWTAHAGDQGTISPTITLTKTASLTTVAPGERITYTVQVRNATTEAVSIQLTDTLPTALSSVTVLTATDGLSGQVGSLITWTGIISQQAQVTITYRAVVTTLAATMPITNQVVVSVAAGSLLTTTAFVTVEKRPQLFMPLIRKEQAPTPTPTLTPTPTPTPTPPAPTMVNGNFESGPKVGWEETSTNFDTLVVAGPSLPNPVTPRSPVYVAWLGGRDNESADLAQAVSIPAGYPTLRLRYYYWSASLDTDCAENSDVAYLKVNDEIRRTFLLCKSNDTNGWREEFISVAQYANQSVTFHFALQLDGAQNSNFFIDDVSFCVDCGP